MSNLFHTTAKNSAVLLATIMLSFTFNSCQKTELDKVSDPIEDGKVSSFVNQLMKANVSERPSMISNFEKNSNIKLSSVAVSKQVAVLDGPTAEQLQKYTPPTYQTLTNYTSGGGGTQYWEPEWIIVQNLFNFWKVNSSEFVVFNQDGMSQLNHRGTAMVGITGGFVDWEESWSQPMISPEPHQGFMSVWGLLKFTGIGNLQIGNRLTVIIKP